MKADISTKFPAPSKLEMSIPLEMFKKDKNFDAVAHYKKLTAKETIITETTLQNENPQTAAGPILATDNK